MGVGGHRNNGQSWQKSADDRVREAFPFRTYFNSVAVCGNQRKNLFSLFCLFFFATLKAALVSARALFLFVSLVCWLGPIVQYNGRIALLYIITYYRMSYRIKAKRLIPGSFEKKDRTSQ